MGVLHDPGVIDHRAQMVGAEARGLGLQADDRFAARSAPTASRRTAAVACATDGQLSRSPMCRASARGRLEQFRLAR